MGEIKPCPFCGSDVIVERQYDPRNFGNACNGCGLETKCYKTQEESCIAWNSRALEATLKEQNKKLIEVLGWIVGFDGNQHTTRKAQQALNDIKEK